MTPCPGPSISPSQANVHAGEVRAVGSIVEHGHSVALRDCIWSQCDEFKSAEEHQGEFLVLPGMMKGASGAHCTPKIQLRQGVPLEAVTGEIHVSSEIEGLSLSRIVWLLSHQDNTILQAYYVLYIMLYTVLYKMSYLDLHLQILA